MATLDFTPLFRSSVGFDRLRDLLSDAIGRAESTYPPYNIEKCGEDRYRIVLALAGFTRGDVEIVLEQSRLFVRGRLKERGGSTFLHRGIANRPFERRFDLADYIEVTGAMMGDGLLVIDLKRELPEALEPRSTPIGTGTFVHLAAKPAGRPTHEDGQDARSRFAADLRRGAPGSEPRSGQAGLRRDAPGCARESDA